MPTRSHIVKLSVFLLSAAALAILVVGLFSPWQFGKKSARYYVRVPGSASGIEPGSAVLVRGVREGSVVKVDPDTAGFVGAVLSLKVSPDVRIKQNDRAFLEMQGITGVKVVDIYGGTADAPPLAPGGYIEHGRTLLDQLSDQAVQLAKVTDEVMKTADRLMGSLAVLVGSVDQRTVHDLVARLDRTVDSYESAGQELTAMLAENRRPLRQTTSNIQTATQEAAEVLAEFRAVAEKADQAVSTAQGASAALETVVRDNSRELGQAVRNLDQSTENLRALSRELRERPSRLIFSEAPPERKLP